VAETVCLAGDARLVLCHWSDVQFRGLYAFAAATAGDRVPAGVDDDRGLQPVRGGDPPALRVLDGVGKLAGIWLGTQDRGRGGSGGLDDA
jgi:hypothetical protein